MNVALILSGGIGSRMGTNIPKQYIEVLGRPIIAYCLETFQKNKGIDQIRVVAHPSWQDFVKPWTGDKFAGFAEPGDNRQQIGRAHV